MNKKLKGIGSLIGKAAAIIGTAGAASLLSDMFLFGGKLTANSDDETTTKTNNDVQMPDVTEESEHFKEEDVKVEDKVEDKEETE